MAKFSQKLASKSEIKNFKQCLTEPRSITSLLRTTSADLMRERFAIACMAAKGSMAATSTLSPEDCCTLILHGSKRPALSAS